MSININMNFHPKRSISASCFGQVILKKKKKFLFIARLVGWHKIYHFSYQESQATLYEYINSILPEV